MNACRRIVSVVSLIGGLLGVGLAPSPVLGQTQAESLSASFRKAAGFVAPSVVAIRPLDPAYPVSPGPMAPLGPIRPFEAATRLPFRPGETDREPMGSGVVIDAERGLVVTNDHVLLGSSQAAVVLADGRERITSQIRRDAGVDLAVLLVDLKGSNLSQARWGDPSALQPGDWVLSIGQSADKAPSISSGIFSSRRRGLFIAPPTEDWLETDAAVNALNSGGPLINLNGEVVGINTALVGRRAQLVGMGFAIPADRARRIVADLVEYGRVRRAFLGVQIDPVAGPTPARPIPPGSVLIGSVGVGTPAAKGGLRPGDVIVKIAGRPVTGVEMLQGLIETAPIGEELTLTIERAGHRQDVAVRPRAQPAATVVGPGALRPGTRPEPRRDALRGRLRGRDQVLPRETPPPLPAPSGEETPSALDPVPGREPPGNAPALDPTKDQPQANPR